MPETFGHYDFNVFDIPKCINELKLQAELVAYGHQQERSASDFDMMIVVGVG